MLPFNKKLKPAARSLRSNMTDAERLVWSRIRKKQISDVQFYRQKNIGNYIVDFYCPQGRLVIELDGGQHYEKEGMKRDQERDSYLQALGLTVMRFSDIDALRNIDGVVERIYEHLKNPPQPSFSKGGNKTSISQRELQMQEASLPFLKGDLEGF